METIPAKTIVTKMKHPDRWFGADYNMNIYRGCSHGCIYCDSRSTCYQNKEFDTVKAKKDALRVIRDDLRRKMKRGVVATGAMSDPYNPIERKLHLTRNALELINAFEFGVAIDTKSSLVTRDLDILQDIKTRSPVIVKITITSADDDLCRKIEPNVAVSSDRFRAMKTLAEGGIYSGLLMMPILPFINDTEDNIKRLIDTAAECGAKFIYPAFGLTLRDGNREYYYEKLEEAFPGIREKYIRTYGNQYQCTSPQARKLWELFQTKCEALGMAYDMKTIIHQYKHGYNDRQLTLF